MKRLSQLIVPIVLTSLLSAPFGYASSFHREEDRLIRTVIFSRHGIRSPTQSTAILKSWADRPWPVWPVSPGKLTRRGEALIKAQWTALKPILEKHGMLPKNTCPVPQQYSLIADKDQRTRKTAIAIFEGLTPGCQIVPQFGKRYDNLFHPDVVFWRKTNHQEMVDQVQFRLAFLEKSPDILSVLKQLQEITGCCDPLFFLHEKGTKHINLMELPTCISVNSHKLKLDISGKWPIASRSPKSCCWNMDNGPTEMQDGKKWMKSH